ncbi:hypothetical protein CALCODRAFT_439207 [Calocera cornea HHB12733]|uniref:Uncharacterized protein n=1 Tax=Calocera cornea HHB12733 TaxID=1353952 RepID=A0A165E435_9BASI|nr:hypothetical protein CALCODRAFT_439207 [Calocera cornea HHB12733]
MSKYPNDRIEIVPKANADPNAAAEWKVKCLDCPGKVRKNPEETLSGFEVHLKNRNHRRAVDARLSGKPQPAVV